MRSGRTPERRLNLSLLRDRSFCPLEPDLIEKWRSAQYDGLSTGFQPDDIAGSCSFAYTHNISKRRHGDPAGPASTRGCEYGACSSSLVACCASLLRYLRPLSWSCDVYGGLAAEGRMQGWCWLLRRGSGSLRSTPAPSCSAIPSLHCALLPWCWPWPRAIAGKGSRRVPSHREGYPRTTGCLVDGDRLLFQLFRALCPAPTALLRHLGQYRISRRPVRWPMPCLCHPPQLSSSRVARELPQRLNHARQPHQHASQPLHHHRQCS